MKYWLAAFPLVLVLVACSGSGVTGHVVHPTSSSICPGDHPIKITNDHLAIGPWYAHYTDTQAVECYDTEAQAAKAGLIVAPLGK